MHDAGTGLLIAILLFAGTCAGLSAPVHASTDAMADMAWVLGVGLTGVGWCLRGRRGAGYAVIAPMPLLVGFISASLETQRMSPSEATGMADREPGLVRAHVELLEPFRPSDAAQRDLLDRFQVNGDRPWWHAKASLEMWEHQRGRESAGGLVHLRIPSPAHHLVPGDRLVCTGWSTVPRMAANPGEMDGLIHAWRNGLVGSIRMETVPERTQQAPWWRHIRHALQRCVDQNIVRGMPTGPDDRVATLVVAMTSGRERPGYASLRTTFAATGLSHFLAISGFNVAVLFGAAVVAMELLGVPGVLRGWCLTALGLLFLAAVDVEVSVLRAGVAGVMAGASLALARGWRADGLLAAAAVGTLLMDPWMAWNPGFQLSYAAVLALRHGSGPMEGLLTWLGIPPLKGVRVALAASLAAWIVSTPITLAWFGSASPWCALVSTGLGPLAASLTITASITAFVGFLPGLDHVLGYLLWLQGWIFLWLVENSSLLPGCRLTVSAIPWWWAALMLGLMFALWKSRNAVQRRTCLISLSLLAAWPCMASRGAEASGTTPPPEFRWTAFAIGDGSVHLIQCGTTSVLFDAGSISIDAAGSRVVVPALRAMGVHHVQAIVLSHPHLDHFSAVPEVVMGLQVDRILVTDAWKRSAPDTAQGTLLAWLRQRGIPVEFACDGFVLRQDRLTWTALHPPAGFRPRSVNDGSLCFSITHPEEPLRPVALLLGDAQDEAIARLLVRPDIRDPWAMELPHHGGWRPMAVELCKHVKPRHVLQSTASRRFERDRLGDALSGIPRGVTCRDGALRFSLDLGKGQAILERWWKGGWRPVVP
jgi:competence protein ComEC